MSILLASTGCPSTLVSQPRTDQRLHPDSLCQSFSGTELHRDIENHSCSSSALVSLADPFLAGDFKCLDYSIRY